MQITKLNNFRQATRTEIDRFESPQKIWKCEIGYGNVKFGDISMNIVNIGDNLSKEGIREYVNMSVRKY